MATETAKKFNDAYFTSMDDAKWCIEKLDALYDLDGKIALEPAAGSGVFLRASKKSGLNWVTNELYPEFARGYDADYSIDFGKDDLTELGRFDFVITNPPFGNASMLARKFVKRALEVSDVVAMLLPRSCRRGSTIDRDIPDDVKIVLDEDLPGGTFDLPDGTTRDVGCVFIVYERIPGYSRGKLCEYSPGGYRAEPMEFRKKIHKVEDFWPDWATHGVCVWGSAGKVFDRSRPVPFSSSVLLQLTDQQANVVKNIDWTEEVRRTCTTTPRITYPVVITIINQALRKTAKTK